MKKAKVDGMVLLLDDPLKVEVSERRNLVWKHWYVKTLEC
jgi:hypothetical protein